MSDSAREHPEQVFAVLRFDAHLAPDEAVTVKEIVWDQSTAEVEVQRLNALNAKKGCRYSWQATRLYSRGGAGRIGLPEAR